MKANIVVISLGLAIIGCGDPGTMVKPGGPGTVQISASGEPQALTGYTWPPTAMNTAVFVDGWVVKFDEILIVVDKVHLSLNPNTSPTNPAAVGKRVAEVDGPWVVDLQKGGKLPGKEGMGDQAVAFTEIDTENLNGNGPLNPTTQYAFGFDFVVATSAAKPVNLDATGMTNLAEMIQKGYAVFYSGTATYMADPTTCMTTGMIPANFPTIVKFRLGFKTPTTYENCQDATNNNMRGIQVQSNAQITAQITLHTDHPLWENFDSDAPPLHFDQMAAVAKKQADNSYLVTLEDTVGENWTAFPVPWRYCMASVISYMPADMKAQMDFENTQLSLYSPSLMANLMSSTGLRDYYDFSSHVQSTQGHLNGNGLCAIQRHFTSIP